MSKSLKLKNDTYVDSSAVVHNKELLSTILEKSVRFKKFEIKFDVSNKSVGDWVEGHTENNIPPIGGMTQIGFVTDTINYADKNFVLEPQWRNHKVYAKMLIGYKEGSNTYLTMTGYIVYAKLSIIDTVLLT